MEKDIIQYLNREINAVDNCILSREQGKNADHCTVTKDGRMIGNWWNSRRPASQKVSKPRYTGGKRAFVKICLTTLDFCRRHGLSGDCIYLAQYIDWDTGYLVIGRGKRRHPMKRQEIVDALAVDIAKGARAFTLPAIKRLIAEMTAHGLMVHDDKGYRVVGLFQKGAAK